MKKVLVFGGNGLTGKKITRLLLSDKRYSKVILLVRKEMDFIHQNLEQQLFDFDADNYVLPDADEVIVCLGTTMKKAGSKENFRKVDYEYIVKIARQAYKQGIQRFAMISAIGANPKSVFYYNRVKGDTEDAIKRIGFDLCLILQPSLLTGTRRELRLGEDIAQVLMSTFSFLLPTNYKPVSSKNVAVTIHKYLNDPEMKDCRIVKSGQIRKEGDNYFM